MKNLVVSFLSIFISLSATGQPDTLFLTTEQKITFETILASFQKREMDVDHIYKENKRFDSIIRAIDKIEKARRYKREDVDPLYQKAKKIYPYSLDVLLWEKPTGCFLGFDLIERTQARLSDFLSLCHHLRYNELELTNDQLNQVHIQQMDGYLSTLQYSLKFIDVGLEGRLWTHLYFRALETVHVSELNI